MKKYLFSFLFSLILGGNLVAGGFQLNEHGAKAMAMGGAFAGLANDLSAFYFNPAGLAFMNGINVWQVPLLSLQPDRLEALHPQFRNPRW